MVLVQTPISHKAALPGQIKPKFHRFFFYSQKTTSFNAIRPGLLKIIIFQNQKNSFSQISSQVSRYSYFWRQIWNQREKIRRMICYWKKCLFVRWRKDKLVTLGSEQNPAGVWANTFYKKNHNNCNSQYYDEIYIPFEPPLRGLSNEVCFFYRFRKFFFEVVARSWDNG